MSVEREAETLVEQRMEQLRCVAHFIALLRDLLTLRLLREISTRRSALLREMYHIIQLRDNVGSALLKAGDEDEDTGLSEFLERFDFTKKCVKPFFHPDYPLILLFAALRPEVS